MKNNLHRVCAWLLAALLLAACLPVTASYAASGDTIHIRTAADLRELAKNCTLDTWSQGKTVLLEADLALEDASFLPIPSFGGTFDGQDHTISGVVVTDSLSPAGLFGELQKSGRLTRLHVEGTVWMWAASWASITAALKPAPLPERCPASSIPAVLRVKMPQTD